MLEDSDPVSFDTAEFSPNPTIERQASKCYENDDYLVIVHPENRNFLIKYKDKNEANYDCVYRIDLTDFEIINRGTDWYLGLQNNFLFIDTGTGPGPRELMIYDIEKRLKVHESLYSPQVDIKSGYIDYWKEVSIEVTRENCPEKDFWEGGELGTAIEQRVRFDLISLKETNLDDFRCEPRQ